MEVFEKQFRNLKTSGGTSPHKPCFLLAVIDAIEAGDVVDNEIRYEPQLLERFERYFKVVQRLPKNFRPYYPFVYLDSSEFWNLHQVNGEVLNFSGNERDQLAKRGVRRVLEVIRFASLDEALYSSLLNPRERDRYRNALVSEYFPESRDKLEKAINESREHAKFVEQFKATILEREFPEYQHLERVSKSVLPRDSTFRKIVLTAYDFKCAATGWKLRTIDNGSLLEAAHIVPHNICLDNRPQNGMALIPTVHKAMDNNLISPGSDLRWHASKFLLNNSQTDEGAKWLWNLDGKKILLPEDERLHPALSSLEWRKENLGKPPQY